MARGISFNGIRALELAEAGVSSDFRPMIRCLVALLIALQAAHALDLSPLEEIPIQEGGRKKPFLVFAQESVLATSGKTTVEIDGKKLPALEIVTSLWLAPLGWDKKPLILVNHKRLKDAVGVDPARKLFSYEELSGNEKLRKLLDEARETRMNPRAQLTGLPKEAATVGERMVEFEQLAKGTAFRFVPHPASAEGQWSPVPDRALRALRFGFETDNAKAFAEAAANFKSVMADIEPRFQPPAWKIHLETIYQKFHPFRWAWICYAAAGLVLLLSRLGRAGYIAAWILAGAGFLLQVAGFTTRIIIAGRAPVTNMYESIVWVAFGTILFALIFEAIYRSRYFLLGAIPVAVLSLILADTQAAALSPAINPLVPVLRDNFWLTIHVLTITLSYAAFALALGISHIALGQTIKGSKVSPALYNYLYRVLQAGVLLIAAGTILGGVWANYSWGRFWDWDPKETWALITLLSYLVVLHGRIAGRWGGFGMAIGAVLCFQCVLMAWYGVNFVLGVGLHSYGFGTGGFGYALAFVAAELSFVLLAFLRRPKKVVPPAAKPDKQLVA